jgi:predicted metal-dependent phosphoesterase TrpH
MAKFDHHLHTSRHSPDSIISPRELIDRARAAGLDGVVITEHDYQWAPGELAELAALAGGLKVFAGAEVSAREGHFLVYGLSDLERVPCGIGLGALLEVVREEQAAIVAAHPFRWDQDFEALVEEHGPAFDALELVSNNVTPATRQKTERVLARHGMGATGSSDAHEPGVDSGAAVPGTGRGRRRRAARPTEVAAQDARLVLERFELGSCGGLVLLGAADQCAEVEEELADDPLGRGPVEDSRHEHPEALEVGGGRSAGEVNLKGVEQGEVLPLLGAELLVGGVEE